MPRRQTRMSFPYRFVYSTTQQARDYDNRFSSLYSESLASDSELDSEGSRLESHFIVVLAGFSSVQADLCPTSIVFEGRFGDDINAKIPTVSVRIVRAPTVLRRRR